MGAIFQSLGRTVLAGVVLLALLALNVADRLMYCVTLLSKV